MKKIILASKSPRRKELLEKIGLKFDIVWSDYEEDMSLDLEPMELARYLSEGKAKSVAKNYDNGIIIAADTFVVLGNKLLGKPKVPKKATEMLKEISWKKLSVISGITIIDTETNKIVSKSIETKAYIKNLSDQEIWKYVDSWEPLDKAWAFGVQWLGAVIIERIEWDYYNVMWLPLNLLSEILKEFGVSVL